MSFKPSRLSLPRLMLGLAAGVGSALFARSLGGPAALAAAALALLWLWLPAVGSGRPFLRIVAGGLAPLLLVALNLALWAMLGLPAPLASGALNGMLLVAVAFLVRKEDVFSSTLAWLFALLGPPAAAMWWSPAASLPGALFLEAGILACWIRGLHGAALASPTGPETTASAGIQLALSLLLHAILSGGSLLPLTVVALALLAAGLAVGFWQSGSGPEGVAGRLRPVRSPLPLLLLVAILGSGVLAWWRFSVPLLETWNAASAPSGPGESTVRADPSSRPGSEGRPAQKRVERQSIPEPAVSEPRLPTGDTAASAGEPDIRPGPVANNREARRSPLRAAAGSGTPAPAATPVTASQPGLPAGTADRPGFPGPGANLARERPSQSGRTFPPPELSPRTLQQPEAPPDDRPEATPDVPKESRPDDEPAAPEKPPVAPPPESAAAPHEASPAGADTGSGPESEAAGTERSGTGIEPSAVANAPAADASAPESGTTLDLGWVPDPILVDLAVPDVPGLADGELAYPDAQNVRIDPQAASIGFLAVPRGGRVPDQVYLRAIVYEEVGPGGFLPADPESAHRTPPATEAPAAFQTGGPRPRGEAWWTLRLGPSATTALPLPTHFTAVAVAPAQSLRWDPERRTARFVGPPGLRDLRFRHPAFESRFPASEVPDIEAASLQLYEDPRINERLRHLSLTWAGGPDRSPEDFVGRVQDRLRARSRYALQTRIPAGWEPALLRWMESGSEGFCVHFAGAFVLLARAYGIPARVVSGYLLTDFDPRSRQFPVHSWNAHAWVEILVDGHWRRIDPTPSSRLLQGLPRTPEVSLASFPEPAPPETPVAAAAEPGSATPALETTAVAEAATPAPDPPAPSGPAPEAAPPPGPAPGPAAGVAPESLPGPALPPFAAVVPDPAGTKPGPASAPRPSPRVSPTSTPPPEDAPTHASAPPAGAFSSRRPDPASTPPAPGPQSLPGRPPGAEAAEPAHTALRGFLPLIPFVALAALLFAGVLGYAVRRSRRHSGSRGERFEEGGCRERAGHLLGELELRLATLPPLARPRDADALHARLLRLRYGPRASRQELATVEALWRELRRRSFPARPVRK